MKSPKKGQSATRIVGCSMAKVSQKDFVEAVREIGNEIYLCGVNYQHPGLFQVGTKKIRVEMPKVSRFLMRLSTVMSFNHYDTLTRSIWVASLQSSDNPVYGVAESRPQFTANPSSPKSKNHPQPL